MYMYALNKSAIITHLGGSSSDEDWLRLNDSDPATDAATDEDSEDKDMEAGDVTEYEDLVDQDEE